MRHFSGLAVGFLVCVFFLSDVVRAQPPMRPDIVYRPDILPPDIVFARGFSQNGQLLSLLDHVIGSSCNASTAADRSAWVSTSSSRQSAAHFIFDQITSGARPLAVSNGVHGLWLYAIRTDFSFLDVATILQRVSQAGRNNRDGYTPRHADIIDHLLSTRPSVTPGEVLAPGIAASQVISAGFATYNPNAPVGQQIFFPQGTMDNPNYNRHPDPNDAMNNRVDDLSRIVPPDSIELYDHSGAWSCLLTCDSGTPRERKRRSAATDGLNCAALPSAAQKLMGSED